MESAIKSEIKGFILSISTSTRYSSKYPLRITRVIPNETVDVHTPRQSAASA